MCIFNAISEFSSFGNWHKIRPNARPYWHSAFQKKSGPPKIYQTSILKESIFSFRFRDNFSKS